MKTLAFFLPHISLADLLSKSMVRLTLAAVLGGIIGLERAFKRKPAGLRTNMFICFGSAMFTILSNELAAEWGIGDHTRIAAQIIPGIGFIGAGSILHAKGSVTGLTTAATIFVVASIGMAVRRRAVPAGDLRYHADLSCAACAGPAGTPIQPEAADDELHHCVGKDRRTIWSPR